MDKNNRNYAISCDWLQLYLHKASNFNPLQPNLFGYNFVSVGHGSKVFKNLYKVIEPTGEQLGIISYDPYSSKIHKNTCIFKLENNVLYQSDYIPRTFQFLACCNFTYKGITRIDLAFDANELYGGLKHETLIKKYTKNEYLKVGLNNYLAYMSGTYKINIKKQDGHEKVNIESEEGIQPHRCESITWGSRSSDIQVQLYNKTKELNDVKMKHYIVDYWKKCGLNTEKDVWRIEIRIVNGGKSVKNLKTGETFNLSMDELMTQELIEQLFHDYAKKYFRFFYRGTQKKVQQMKEIKLFPLNNITILKPQRITKEKDFTRMHKITVNWIDKNIYENANLDNVIVREMEAVRNYFISAYGMEKWYKEHQEQSTYNQEITNNRQKDPGQTIQDKYKITFKGLSNQVAERAAKLRKQIEEEIIKIKEIDQESTDYDWFYLQDVFRMDSTHGKAIDKTPSAE